MSDEKIKLNGKDVSKEQLQEKKKQVDSQKGMKLVEVKPGEYRTKLEE